jgi:hypothetical protein
VPNGVGVSLARNRRSPKCPSEPRPSGVHLEEAEVAKDGAEPSSEICRGVDSGRVLHEKSMLRAVDGNARAPRGCERLQGKGYAFIAVQNVAGRCSARPKLGAGIGT